MLERTIDFILLIPRHLIYGSDNAVSHFCENHVDKYSYFLVFITFYISVYLLKHGGRARIRIGM